MIALRLPLAGAAVALCLAALCADTRDPGCSPRDPSVRWVRTAPVGEHAALDRWCAGVGPPARFAAPHAPSELTGTFAVVSWNTHVGGGDIPRLVADLRAGRLTDGIAVRQFVLLLQEVYRAGPAVPRGNRNAIDWASVEGPSASPAREDVLASARRLDLDAIYIPSMRNGAPERTDEDRGNAILATAPLGDVTAIELPLERQRRVAIQATVHVRTSATLVPVVVVDTHFTNMVLHHLWVMSVAGRVRQARALGALLPPSGPLVIGGDFNAWFGYHDAAYRELARHAAPSGDEDRRASFSVMRLDHLLFRLPDGWQTHVRRADDRYGSDHYPIVALVEPR